MPVSWTARPPAARALVAAACLAGSPAYLALAPRAWAQPPAPRSPAGQQPAPFENLKVYPKDIPHDSLLAIMRGFTVALGVNCQYCHVAETVPATATAAGGSPGTPPGGGPGGPPRERLRPALDDKQAKQTARFMIRMADSLNRVVLAALPDRHRPAVGIACVTCHRGSPLPQTIDAALAERIERAGVDSALARYRQLRGDMVSGRYDFREGPLVDLAQSLAGNGHTADALKVLQMAQEFAPSSPNVDLAMGDVYLKAGDRDQAVTRYRVVLTKRPNDPRARQRLQELGVPAAGGAAGPGATRP